MTEITVVFGEIARVNDPREAGKSRVRNFVIKSVSTFGKESYAKFWDCALWGDKADTSMEEGSAVAVRGTVKADKYDWKGETRSKLVLSVKDIVVGQNNRDEEPEYEMHPF